MEDAKSIDILSLTDEELEQLERETPEVYEAITSYLVDYISTVIPNLFQESAGIGAKFDRAVSFPAHVVTAVLAGGTLYLYNQHRNRRPIAPLDVKLLCTVLTLHDIQKFWNEKTGENVRGTTVHVSRIF